MTQAFAEDLEGFWDFMVEPLRTCVFASFFCLWKSMRTLRLKHLRGVVIIESVIDSHGWLKCIANLRCESTLSASVNICIYEAAEVT